MAQRRLWRIIEISKIWPQWRRGSVQLANLHNASYREIKRLARANSWRAKAGEGHLGMRSGKDAAGGK